jgi:additional sex combs-like protein
MPAIDIKLEIKNEKPARHTHHLRKARVTKIVMPNSAEHDSPTSSNKQASTMREVLASIPGFSIKRRSRPNRKLSTAAQLEKTREGCIDLNFPDSILTGTNLRALLNKTTFSKLPVLYQYKLIQLLPIVDRQILQTPIDFLTSEDVKLSSSSLNNEFFARACLEWRERLSDGEFTPENQLKLKTESEREKSKLDPWKLKHFEPIWGRNIHETSSSNNQRPALKTTIKLRPTASITTSTLISKTTTSPPKSTKSQPTHTIVVSPKRVRTVGAMTRASTAATIQKSPSDVSELAFE